MLLADELEASLHPVLVAQFVRLFQYPETNPKRAQLIFNSHDDSLLGDSAGERELGRDQVWLSDKSNDGVTRILPLSRYSPRKDEAVSKRYRRGGYGAVPIVSHQDFADAISLLGALGA